ncbi:hypothetical protein LMJF_11_0940 [Leishmania major strain Friedlin]|uniref:Uncharacterized protein n=1 Tax=Leishmania major TaxID=5664 RepID=Q4QGY5_LEIMA|nr:hypothetical protein LMJF_11_0940 [Leishmania major strain Friedlin]CAG9570249.1 hypothetical_protein_-_conserved [Leishmania major strain Friedlin]CAJ02858.2 hypothetical protein LMJF_11_0940 [Leishmania major strain Friedlin]|eukprot:XP_001681563.2 hypothetical protein LMJF_11_0940 [Leishmania major strain Friedlin]
MRNFFLLEVMLYFSSPLDFVDSLCTSTDEMAHHTDKSRQHYAKISALALDSSSHYEEQRARMQSVDLNYLQQKSNECIENRHAPSSLYTTYACCQAAMAVPQESYFTRFVPNGSSPARRSELASRIVAQRNYFSYCRKPLECGGAISLQQLSQSPPAASSQQGSRASVFFDDERFDETHVVFINGEPHRFSGGHQSERTLYGLDSPTAAIRDAVTAAAAHQAEKSNTVSSSGGVQKRWHVSQEQSSTTSRIAEPKRRTAGFNGTCKRQHGKGSTSSDRYRDFLSPSGQLYRVFRLHKRHLPPIGVSEKAKGFSFHAKGAKDASRTKKSRDREPAECDRDIDGRRELREDRVAADHRSGGRRPVKDDKVVSPVWKGHTAKPHKSHETSKNVRGKRNGRRQLDAASHQNSCATKHTCRRCQRNLNSTSPRNASSESSSSWLLSPSASPSEDIADTRTGDRDCDGPSSCRERRQRSHDHHGASQNDKTHRRLPPIGGDQLHRPVPPPPSHPSRRPRDAHRRRRQHNEGGRHVTKRRGSHSDVLSDSSDLSSLLSDSAVCVWSSLSSSIDSASDMSDCVVMDKPQRSPSEEHWQQRGTAQCRRAGSASPLISEGDGKDQELFECSNSCLSDREPEWEDADCTSSSFSSTSLPSSELSSTSTWRAEVRRPRGRDGRRRHRRSAHSPPSPSRKGGRPGARGSASNRHRRRDGNKTRNTRRPVCSPSSPSSSSDDSDSDRSPGKPRARSRAARATQSRSHSRTRPPIVHAVAPAHPPRALPPLMEEVLPSTRYATSAATPLAQRPQMAQATEATHSCASPAVRPPRTEQGTIDKGVGQSHGTVEPTRRAYQKMPTSPLQVNLFCDLVTPSVESSGPVCTSSQAEDSNKGGASPQQQSHKTGEPTPSPATEPLDLDYITEHVLRVIQNRLAGKDNARDDDAATALRTHEAAGRERARQEEVREAAKRAAEQVRLRDLLREAQQEARQAREEQLSLSSLTDSLQFAFAQITRLMEHGDGTGDDTARLGLTHEATNKGGNPSTAVGTLNSNTLVYCAAGSHAMTPPGAGASAVDGGSARDTAVAVEGGHTSSLPDSVPDAATLQRLITVLRRRRHSRQVELRFQRQRAEKAEAKALEAAQQQQQKQELDELVANEHQARASLRRAEEEALDELLVSAASVLEEAIGRMMAAQVSARMLLLEEEFNKRTEIVASEEEEAADFWHFAADLYQAAEDAEAERLQAEAERMEAEGVAAKLRKGRDELGQRSSGSGTQSTAGVEKIVVSNLIPGQLLGIEGGKSIENGGKIRLIGDPYVEAVEAHARERRRLDRLRQQRLASALPSRPETNKANDAAGSRLSSRQPSTVRTGFTGGAVSALKLHSRASSRNFPVLSPGRLSSDGNTRVGERSPSQNRLPSQSNFVFDGDVDLQVYGRQVGIPSKTRSPASLLASARGTPVKGGADIAARPYNKRPGEGLLLMDMYASQIEH